MKDPVRICEAAQAKLDGYIKSLSKACKVEADCQPFYLRVSSCEMPEIINKSYKPDNDKKLFALHESVRKDCKENLAKQPACSPYRVFPACYKNLCTTRNLVPITLRDQDIKGPFSYAQIFSSCAPNDGPAIRLVLTKSKEACNDSTTFPQVHLHYWGHQSAFPMTKPIHAQVTEGSFEGSASFCVREGSCVSSQKMELNLDQFDGKKGKGSFKLFLPDNREVKSEFEVEFCEGAQALCG